MDHSLSWHQGDGIAAGVKLGLSIDLVNHARWMLMIIMSEKPIFDLIVRLLSGAIVVDENAQR